MQKINSYLGGGSIIQSEAQLWTPSVISKRAWYDASDNATITHLSNIVSQWNDKSGNALHFTQTDNTKRPTLVPAGQNGLNYLQFGGSHIMAKMSPGPVFTNIGNGSIFAVRKSTSATVTRFVAGIETANAGSFRASLGVGSTTGLNEIRGRRLDSDGIQIVTGTISLSTTEFQIQHGLFDYVNNDAYIYLDGAQDQFTSSFQTVGNTTNSNSNAISVGGNVTTGVYFLGGIAEILILEYAVDITLRQIIEGYFAHKWGFASSLNIAHPYKSQAPTI